MTEPSPARPVPGPPRPGTGAAPEQSTPQQSAADASSAGRAERNDGRFADLDERPVSEHVAVFEAEHDRLQRELGTIDQL